LQIFVVCISFIFSKKYNKGLTTKTTLQQVNIYVSMKKTYSYMNLEIWNVLQGHLYMWNWLSIFIHHILDLIYCTQLIKEVFTFVDRDFCFTMSENNPLINQVNKSLVSGDEEFTTSRNSYYKNM